MRASSWAWWEAVARLEAAKKVLGYDYHGTPPTALSSWQQVSDAHLCVMGIGRFREYRRGV